MTGYLIRVDGELSPALLSAFPHLKVDVHTLQSVLSGEMVDSAELTGIVNHLDSVGLQIVDHQVARGIRDLIALRRCSERPTSQGPDLRHGWTAASSRR